MFAFAPDVKLVVATSRRPESGTFRTDIALTIGENKENAKMWVSQGRKIPTSRELNDLSKDALAENRSKLDLKNAPATGNPNARLP